MPAKTTPEGDKFKIDGKKFVWTTDTKETVTIPLRIKLGVLRSMGGKELDTGTMFEMIDKIAPGQEAVLDEMDVNDFVRCFTTWQREYNALNGATPGE